jgi:hypothetical protein
MPVKKLGEYKVPFGSGGSLLDYASWEYDRDQSYTRVWRCEWRDNKPFHLCLSLADMYSGRSAKGVIWRHEDGRTFPMFVVDLLDMLQHCVLSYGVAVGYWAVRKRGQNYGLVYLGQHWDAEEGA